MKKKNYSPKFKSNIALDVIENQNNIEELAAKHSLHITLIRRWEKKLRSDAYKVFLQEENKDFVITHERDVL
jgi:transposase-like protein